MRRRLGWPSLILALGASVAMATTAISAETAEPTKDKPTKVALGTSPAYKMFSGLPLMHMGRIKPLDTVAREEIKLIYTRETIWLKSEDGKTFTSWSPVAAFFDWSIRPKFWDEQPIISVEYVPLKQFILAEEIKNAIDLISGKASTSEADRTRLKALAKRTEIDAASIRSLLRVSQLDKADASTLEKLAVKVGEETKWLSPTDLETADVTVDDKKQPFLQWLDALTKRSEGARPMMGGKPKLTELETKAFELGGKLGRYRAIRDRETLGMVPLLVMPRPANQAMLLYSGEALEKARAQGGPSGLSALELESAGNLYKYYDDIPIQDQAEPGKDPRFDSRYTLWLKEKSAWVPLGVIRETPIEELSKAGYPASKVEAFRTAYKAMEDEELARPGQADEKFAIALIDAARDLGNAVNASYYPSSEAMDREVFFNNFAPFLLAPVAYGLGFLALTFSLVATNFGASIKMPTSFGILSKLLYVAGMVSFASGIGLETIGFNLRIKITGWAPVTNMYETVIWVAMLSAFLGLVLEAIYKKTYAALAGSAVALLGTALAATVPLLDPNIHQLPPVLRSNFWLTIHVLTIVSSYAAFALAMGLGMIATTLYLSATFKRSARLGELALPLLPGLPLLGLGLLGWYASDGHLGAGEVFKAYGFWPSVVVAYVGGFLSGTSFFAILGENLNRVIARKTLDPGGTLHPDVDLPHDPYRATFEPKPGMNQDQRAQAMQWTASVIKPISNFIYRSMQVGILLVAAGTFLGGWWADVSWGRFWGWDPKEVWALITLLVYLIPLHGRFAGWVNTFWLVVCSVVCFLSVLMAWYGVNFVLGVGLHSYGFTQGGGQGIVAAVSIAGISYAFGAAWRRHLSQNIESVPV